MRGALAAEGEASLANCWKKMEIKMSSRKEKEGEHLERDSQKHFAFKKKRFTFLVVVKINKKKSCYTPALQRQRCSLR
jgi:hypothetical protein